MSTQKEYSGLLQNIAAYLCEHNEDAEIHFLGRQSSDEIRTLLSQCDIFVLPSRSEACPIALLEAMAMKNICVATNVGGVDEIVSNQSIAILAEPNEKSLSEKLLYAYHLPVQERLKMGGNARNRVVKYFSKENISQHHLDIYKSLMHE